MLEDINSFLCGALMPILLCVTGIGFLIKTKAFFILHPIKTVKEIKCGVGGFRSLCVALAGTLGIGNIVGVASAIIMGGAGAVFWMILSAFIAMSLKYAEVYLAIRHRRGAIGSYYGGAPYYISDALGGRRGFVFGAVFALLCIINSLSTGNLVQINSLTGFIPSGRLFFGIAFALCVFFVIKGGERRIQSFSAVLIPFLTFLYIIVSFYIIFSNLDGLCVAISRIFSEAFSIKSAASGAIGYGMASAIRYGFSRGLLSNEAGCGTAPTAHASSSQSPHRQGCLGIFEVFWDTVVLCLLSALVILIADTGSSEPIMLVISSYGKFTGNFGRFFIAFSCVLFALATVSCQYYYGERSLRFITKSKRMKYLYSVIFFSVCILSTLISNEIMWHISDTVVAALTVYNLIFLIILAKEVE